MKTRSFKKILSVLLLLALLIGTVPVSSSASDIPEEEEIPETEENMTVSEEEESDAPAETSGEDPAEEAGDDMPLPDAPSAEAEKETVGESEEEQQYDEDAPSQDRPEEEEFEIVLQSPESPAEITAYVTVGESGALCGTSDGKTAAELPVKVESGSMVLELFAALHTVYLSQDAFSFSEENGVYAVNKFWGRSGTCSVRCNGSGVELTASVLPGGQYEVMLDPAEANYARFQTYMLSAEAGTAFELTLSQYASGGYSAVSGARITVNGTNTDVTTDSSGTASLTVTAPGIYVVSAYRLIKVGGRNIQTIQPPVCVVTVSARPSRLSSLTISTGLKATEENTLLNGDFSENTMSYDLGEQYDDIRSLYFQAIPQRSGDKIEVIAGEEKKDISDSGETAIGFSFLVPGTNRFSVNTVPSDSSGSPVSYSFEIRSIPTLSSLRVFSDDSELLFSEKFEAQKKEYVLNVPENLKTLKLEAVSASENVVLMCSGGDDLSSVSIDNADSVTISVKSLDKSAVMTYEITLQRTTEGLFRIQASPAEAVIKVFDKFGGEMIPDEENWFHGMFAAGEYTYSVQCTGFISQNGAVPLTGGKLSIQLEAAEEQPAEVESEWKNFRNSDDNMGITDVTLPTEEDTAVLLWSASLGSGWENAPSVQILADGALIVMSGTFLYKLDPKSGEILARGSMTAEPNWGYTPPTYSNGMIFCPLSGGMIQAFNASTLESLWIYKDSLGGQSLSPITCSGGYLYTGFWTGETTEAAYVCLTVTDEDTSRPDEEKHAVWRRTHKGGFYWAGSVVVGNAVIVGTEDGVNSGGDSMILSLHRTSGALTSSLLLPKMGDQRASIAYAKERGRIYFCTQAGYLCSAAVDSTSGRLSDLKYYHENGQSTSTPVVYGDRVFYGIGSGISSSGSSGRFVVADADTLETVASVELRGYPQCSQLLSTAYQSKGLLYFYSTYNSLPGGITLIRMDMKDDSLTTAELYEADGFSEYCISSLICSSDGVIYYKNDSGNVMAVGLPKTEAVERLIDSIGTVTAESGNAVRSARAAYDALSETDRTKVKNYAVLEAAEAVWAQIEEKIGAVEKAIEDVGTVDGTEACRTRVQKARKAFDALTAAEKKLVENTAALLDAEKQQGYFDNARNTEKLIYDIGDVIDTEECRKKVEAARASYDELLSTEKKIVINEGAYAVLTEAERKLSATAGGKTRSLSTNKASAVSVTLDGITYLVDKPAAELIKKIVELTKAGPEADSEEILQAWRDYSELSDDYKKQILNYDDLEALCVVEGVKNHTIGEEILEGLPWFVSIDLREANNGEYVSFSQKMNSVGSCVLLRLWRVSLFNKVTGEPYVPEESLTLDLPLWKASRPEMDPSAYELLRSLRFDESGHPVFGTAGMENGRVYFSVNGTEYCALVGASGESSLQLPEEELPELPAAPAETDADIWPFVVAAALGVLLLVFVLVLKKREKDGNGEN